MSVIQAGSVKNDSKPLSNSSVVEKLTSIYGVSQTANNLGTSTKKVIMHNDFTSTTIR